MIHSPVRRTKICSTQTQGIAKGETTQMPMKGEKKMAKKEKMVTRTTTCTRARVEGFNVETKSVVECFFESEGKLSDEEVKFEASNSGYFCYEVLSKEFVTEKRCMPYSLWIRYSKPVNGQECEVDGDDVE